MMIILALVSQNHYTVICLPSHKKLWLSRLPQNTREVGETFISEPLRSVEGTPTRY